MKHSLQCLASEHVKAPASPWTKRDAGLHMNAASAFNGRRYPCSCRCRFEVNGPNSKGRNSFCWRDAIAAKTVTRRVQEQVSLKLTAAADRMLFIGHLAMHHFLALACAQRLLFVRSSHLRWHELFCLEEEQERACVLTTYKPARPPIADRASGDSAVVWALQHFGGDQRHSSKQARTS